MAANCTDAQRREELLTIAETPAITRNISRRRSGRRASYSVHEHHSAIRIQRQFAIVGALDQYMLPFYQTSLTQGEDAAS